MINFIIAYTKYCLSKTMLVPNPIDSLYYSQERLEFLIYLTHQVPIADNKPILQVKKKKFIQVYLGISTKNIKLKYTKNEKKHYQKLMYL